MKLTGSIFGSLSNWLVSFLLAGIIFPVGCQPEQRFSGTSDAEPPLIIPEAPRKRPSVLVDGTLKSFFSKNNKVMSVISADGGYTWSEPVFEFKYGRGGAGVSTADKNGDLHVVLTDAHGQGKPGITRFRDIWHCRTVDGGTQWGEPKCCWKGYCGAVMDIKQLSTGRILIPFGHRKTPEEKFAYNTGAGYTTVLYSNDNGRSWQLSGSKLTSPCYENYNGNNYGAIEPTILELKDGRVWMLMRTQTGFLYESFSEDGIHWSEARASRFYSPSAPCALVRLADGKIALFWNNCQKPARINGKGLYAGRDALHAAVSYDEGKSWQGFREVYRDPYRNESPPRQGDRGTAYPGAVVNEEGSIVLVTGQGNRRTEMIIDPQWLVQTYQYDDFSEGLDKWHVWKTHGPIYRYWRNRTQGPELIDYPFAKGGKVLHIRRPDAKAADTAIWNFPAGVKGRLTMRIQLQKGNDGAKIALTDRFFNPIDADGTKEAMFCISIGSKGNTDSKIRLEADRWYTLELEWDLFARECLVYADGEELASVRRLNATRNGISYLRLCSTAKTPNVNGLLLDWVEVSVTPPTATK